jgi:hypothetical protein
MSEEDTESSSGCLPTIGEGNLLSSPDPLMSINVGARRGEDLRIDGDFCSRDELADCGRRNGSTN